MSKFIHSISFFAIAIIICLSFAMCGCMGGGNTEPTPVPTVAATSETPAETSTSETTTTTDSAITTEPGTKGEINIKDVMKMSDEGGKTPEEKYGNAIFASSMVSGFALLDFGTGLMGVMTPTTGTGGEAPKPEELMAKFKEISEKNKKVIEDIKAEVSALTPPKGYEKVHENTIAYYDKIIEGINAAIEGAENKDAKKIESVNKIMEDSSKLIQDAMKELDGKGYKPSEEFQKKVYGMFENPMGGDKEEIKATEETTTTEETTSTEGTGTEEGKTSEGTSTTESH